MAKKKVLGDFAMPLEGDIIDQIAGSLEDAADREASSPGKDLPKPAAPVKSPPSFPPLGSDRKQSLLLDQATRMKEADLIKEGADFKELLHRFGIPGNFNGSPSAMILCPFHADKTPSCSINFEKKLFNCFGCGKKGDIIDFVKEFKGTDFKGALEFLDKGSASPIESTGSGPGVEKKGESKPTVDRELTGSSPAARRAVKRSGTTSPEDHSKPVNQDIPDSGHKAEETKSRPVSAVESLTDKIKLIQSIFKEYEKKLYANKEVLEYLEKRGLNAPALIARYHVGYCEGKDVLDKYSIRQRKVFKEVGLINKYGKEHFANSIVIPIFDENGGLAEAYGRKLTPRTMNHLYLPGPHKGIFNYEALKVYDSIILTESIIDALSLIHLGIENVSACFGTGGFTPPLLRGLRDNRVKEVIIAFDNDHPGKAGADKLAEKLLSEKFKVKTICPQAKDWNAELIQGTTKKEIESLIEKTEVKLPRGYKKPMDVEKEGLKYTFQIGEISYRVQGVKEMFVSSLRVNIKAEEEGLTFYDNVELYSARSRANFAGNLGAMLELTPRTIENDLIRMLEYFEKERDDYFKQLEEQNLPVDLTEEEKINGSNFLKSPDLMEQITGDLTTLGYVGEDLNKQLMYIAATSRKMDDPLSIMVLSQSSAGKSFLVDTVRKLIPEEDVINITSLSDQALNYLPEGGLIHKFLILGEAVYSETIEHQIREMLSAHHLSRLVTLKDPKTGKMVSQNRSNKVIVSAVMSSTNYKINPENASRCFVINTDESKEQTGRIHRRQKSKYSFDRYLTKKQEIPGIIKKHYAAQRLLKKILIINPYSRVLKFPDNLVRTRRDHDRFIDLIASVCFLRQFQKEVKIKREGKEEIPYIECDVEDYRISYKIMVNSVLKSTYAELPKSLISFYEELRLLYKKEAEEQRISVVDVRLTQRIIRKSITSIGSESVKKYIRKLVSLEYLLVAGGHFKGGRFSYQLVADEGIATMDYSMIPTPEQIGIPEDEE